MKALLAHELRSILSSFRRRPLVPLLALTMLALGFAANVAVFTVISRTLLRPLPYLDAGRLRVPITTFVGPDKVEDEGPSGPLEIVQWQQRSTKFAAIEGLRSIYMTMRDDGDPQGVAGALVTGGIFRLFGVRPALGRDFTREDDVPNARVAILTHGCWQRRFGGSRDAIGRTVMLDGHPTEIIGVLPRAFEVAAVTPQPELFIPSGLSPANMPTPTSRAYTVFGRLKDGVQEHEALLELQRIIAALGREYPDVEKNHTAHMKTLRDAAFGDRRHALLILWIMVTIVHVLACINVASVLSAQIADERGLTALRLALGAGRSAILRYRLMQTVIITTVGAIAGMLLGSAALRVLLRHSADANLTTPVEHAWVVPLFLFALALMTALLVAVVPALRETKTRLTSALNEQGTRASSSVRATRLRELFIILEVALAVPLLLAATAMIREFRALQRTPLGFDPNHVLISQLVLSPKYDKAGRATFARELIRRIEAIPGVESAATTTCFFSPGSTTSTVVASDRFPELMTVNLRRITPHYFTTMRIPLIAGRAYEETDTLDSPPVAIIDASLAKRLFPGENALGKRLLRTPPAKPSTIIGIAPDVYDDGPAAKPRPTFYSPYLQTNNIYVTLVVRVKGDALAMRDPVRRAVWSLDRDLTPSSEAALADLMVEAVGSERLQMLMLTGFGVIALVLATVGIYGMTAYAVMSRMREIGVRLAFGATPGDVRREVIGRAIRSVSIGLLAGAALSFAAQRFASALVSGRATIEWQSAAVIGAVLFLAAFVAALIPSARARSVQPVWLLREGG